MRRVLILLTVVFAFSFVSATLDVQNYSVDDSYSPFENISGEINLTIVGEEYDSLVSSNDDDEIKLGDFLSASGNLFECSPPDCSNDYSSSNGVVDKSFSVSASGYSYVGLVIEGEDVVVNSLSFKIDSDFGVSARRPLTINFFEGEEWKFDEFSGELLNKDWGCYNPVSGSEGPSIGDILYCEMISVPDTGSMKIGAVIGGSDTMDLDMTVYPASGTGGEWSCSYDPNSAEGCMVSADIDDIFSAGDYQICVSADDFTGYKIYDESVGDTCGFAYVSGPSNSSKDYGIYARGVKYASASLLSSVDFGNDDVLAAANDLIANRYEGDCTDGCILPMAFSGVSQNARIHDVLLTFTKNLELDSTNKVYDLDVVPVTVDFFGVLDLRALGFSVSKAMEYIVSFGGSELFSAAMEILPAPIILSVFPLDPPAGVPIEFYVGVNYTNNKSLTYKWDFGDDTIANTEVPSVMHIYADLKNYTLIIEVSAGGNLTSKKSFSVGVISPEVAVNASLGFKRSALNGVVAELASFPAWYGGPLGKLINVDFYVGELDRIERARDNAFVDSDFIKVAEELYALDVPAAIGVEHFDGPYLIANIGDIDIEPVEIIGGAISGATNAAYAGSILNWQNLNVDASFVSEKFSVLAYSDEQSDIFRTYSFDVKLNYDRESYFVINKPFSELYFKESVGARKAGNATVIILPAGSETSFEFYYESAEPTTFFVSPKLSSIVIEADIDTSCNYNLVCEEEYGENSDTCRSDCKPVAGMIVYLILSLVFVLILYSVLQIWYKRRYENFLFKDRRQLYNLLMYVTNARARGMTDDRIAAELRSQGWSSERVNYIIKKSIGKRTGLYEIIPFGKIAAYFRNRKAVKAQAAKFATRPQQQIGRNINKSVFPRR